MRKMPGYMVQINSCLERCIFLFVSLLLFSVPSYAALSANQIFKKTTPGVVLIRSIQGFGSGVVASKNGGILTSYHVVNSPFDFEVVARVSKGNKIVTRVYKDVKLIGVHPNYDLALLKVDLQEGEQLISIPYSRNPPKTGEPCYVIGNPAGDNDTVLDNSISSGIISAANRYIDGMEYIQVTAPINPGNSGGALCNAGGALIGIITFKVDQAEGLGFAIPIKDISSKYFLPPKDRKVNKKRADTLASKGDYFYDMSKVSPGLDAELSLYLACVCYQMALTEDHTSWEYYLKAGKAFIEAGRSDLAEKYLEKALEIKPNSSKLYAMYGYAIEQNGQPKKAVKQWQKGLKHTSDTMGMGLCAARIASCMLDNKKLPEAAYFSRWSKVTVPHLLDYDEMRNDIYQTALNELTDSQISYLSVKSKNFSIKNMKDFVKGNVSMDSDTLLDDSDFSLLPDISQFPLLEEIKKKAPPINQEGLSKKLPDELSDAQLAMYGAYIVLNFKSINKVGIFDIARCQIIEYITVSDKKAKIAAAGKYLIIYTPESNTFQKWDLSTMSKIKEAPSRITGEITLIEGSCDNDDRIVVAYTKDNTKMAEIQYGLIDLNTFKVTTFPTKVDAYRTTFRCSSNYENIRLRLNHDGTAFVIWRTSVSPSGLEHVQIEDSTINVTYTHESPGELGFAHNQQVLFGASGKIYNPQGGLLDKLRKTQLYAASGADYFVSIAECTNVMIQDWPSKDTIASINLPFDWPKEDNAKSDIMSIDKQIHASARLDRVAFIDQKGKTAYVYAMGLTKAQKAFQKNAVLPGSLWIKPLAVPAETKIRIEDAPKNLKYDSKTQKLSWMLPGNQKPGLIEVLISVKEPDKDEYYIIEKITVAPL